MAESMNMNMEFQGLSPKILLLILSFFIERINCFSNVAFRIETSRPEVFCKKGILTNFANFTGKHKQILENKFCTILLSLNFKRNRSFQYLRNILDLKTIPFRDRLKISLILISKYK